MFNGYLVIMKGLIEGGLYMLQGSTVIGSVSMVTEDADKNVRLWHSSLAHISERGLIELNKEDLLCGNKLGKLQFCEHCAGKIN